MPNNPALDRNVPVGRRDRLPDEIEWYPASPPQAAARPPRRFLPLLLFIITCLTTLLAGFLWNAEFSAATSDQLAQSILQLLHDPTVLLAGSPFAFSVLVILICHEMGHYLACRFHKIDATVPYVIPAPPPLNPFGTFGAVIRIKSLFRDRRQLFDVGIAGPLAGFVLILPVLAVGVALSTQFQGFDSLEPSWEFGEPLLFQLAVKLFFRGDPAYIQLHPVGWAAWFGMLATSLNLLPVGQLDGGHVVYALFGSRVHRIVSYVTFISLVLLSLLSWPMLGYLLFAVILLFLRFRHPRPYNDAPQLGRARWILALVALVVFVVTFMPVPVRVVQHVGSL
ncbi:MAG: site-2 protease family protein [Acidobacteriota bacterium]